MAIINVVKIKFEKKLIGDAICGIKRLAINPPKCQNPERIKTPKFEYPTCIKSEISFRIVNSPKLRIPEFFFARIPVTSTYRSPESVKFRKSYSSKLLFLRYPSYTDIDVIFINARQNDSESTQISTSSTLYDKSPK